MPCSDPFDHASLQPGTSRRLLLVRTFVEFAAGGPVPPLGILYLASVVRESMGGRWDCRVIDTGISPDPVEKVAAAVSEYRPHVLGLSTLSCEADLMDEIAAVARNLEPRPLIVAGGSHVSASRGRILENANIDIAVIGEAEKTLPELLAAIDSGSSLENIDGIVFRFDGRPVETAPRRFIENLDDLPFPAWDLLDIAEYSRFRNWNGFLKEKPYAPVITSRGCPYSCRFCHDTFGKRVRARSPGNVIKEILLLKEVHNVREIHIIDDIFNFDEKRALDICRGIEKSTPGLSFAFPNGLRADILSGKLLDGLKRIGTYKIHFGFETASPERQAAIGKNLDLPGAVTAVEGAVKRGILTGGYFMLGFPGETPGEMEKTIDFAVSSRLDSAYFFKVTPFPGTSMFREADDGETSGGSGRDRNREDYHFFSAAGSGETTGEEDLNRMIFLAQRRFYFNLRRFLRGFFRTPHRMLFISSYISALSILLQSYLFSRLAGGRAEGGGRSADA